VSDRGAWVGLSDSQLLDQCEVDLYRASGPGGQKRNKTSSAVRLRHRPSGLIAIANESRSQHENKAKALRRLRAAFFLDLRQPFAASDPALAAARSAEGRFNVGPKDPRYLPAAAALLDLLDATAGGVREAAERLGTTTAHLVDFLQADDRAWRSVNALRARHSRSPLRA
jgi:hypothetical protein